MCVCVRCAVCMCVCLRAEYLGKEGLRSQRIHIPGLRYVLVRKEGGQVGAFYLLETTMTIIQVLAGPTASQMDAMGNFIFRSPRLKSTMASCGDKDGKMLHARTKQCIHMYMGPNMHI